MDTTLLSATNNSNCSRREGVSYARMGAVRFSLRIGRETPGEHLEEEFMPAGVRHHAQGGVTWRRNHAALKISRYLARMAESALSRPFVIRCNSSCLASGITPLHCVIALRETFNALASLA